MNKVLEWFGGHIHVSVSETLKLYNFLSFTAYVLDMTLVLVVTRVALGLFNSSARSSTSCVADLGTVCVHYFG